MGTHCAFPSRRAQIAVQNPGPNAGPSLWARIRRSAGTFHAAMQCLNLSACCLLGCVREVLYVPCVAAQHALVYRKSTTHKQTTVSRNSTEPWLEPKWIQQHQACISEHTARKRDRAVLCHDAFASRLKDSSILSRTCWTTHGAGRIVEAAGKANLAFASA